MRQASIAAQESALHACDVVVTGGCSWPVTLGAYMAGAFPAVRGMLSASATIGNRLPPPADGGAASSATTGIYSSGARCSPGPAG